MKEPRKLKTIKTVCKVGACEPICGIEVDIEGGATTEVRPDKQHSLFEGYVCIKGMNILGYQNSPDRLTRPLRRRSLDRSHLEGSDRRHRHDAASPGRHARAALHRHLLGQRGRFDRDHDGEHVLPRVRIAE